MMDSILDSLTAEKLYPSGGTNLLDLEELSDGDFLTNVVRLFLITFLSPQTLSALSLSIFFFLAIYVKIKRTYTACSARSRTSGGRCSC